MEHALRKVLCAAFTAAAVLSTAAAPARGDLKDAVAAYRAGAYKEALKDFTAAAEAGNAIAQYNVGVMYLTGQGVEKDLVKAARWHRLAADQGLAMAQYGLGVMYYRGDGIAQDYAEAARWFRKAADQGLANAQYNLGVMYFNGQGLKREMPEVVKWISLAAAKGHPEALYRLGAMYETGEPFQADPNQALLWYRKAAEAGHKAALTRAQALGAKIDPEGEGVGDPLTASPKIPPVAMPDPGPPKPEMTTTVSVDPPAAQKAPKPDTADKQPDRPVPAKPEASRQAAEKSSAEAKSAVPEAKPAPPEPKPAPPEPKPAPPAAKPAPPSEIVKLKPPASIPLPAAQKPKAPPGEAQKSVLSARGGDQKIVLTPPKPRARPDKDDQAQQPGWSVQLAAYRSESEANEAWRRFSQRHKAILGNLRPIIKQITLKDKGTYHRLRVMALQNKTAAEAFCRQLKLRDPSQGCIAVPPGAK